MANEKRLIDANILKTAFENAKRSCKTELLKSIYSVVLKAVNDCPTVDAVEVVRCKDCKHYDVFRLECHNGRMNGRIGIDGFCSYGERKDNG